MAKVIATADKVGFDLGVTGSVERALSAKVGEVVSATDFGVASTVDAFIKVKRGPTSADAFALVAGYSDEADRRGGLFFWDSGSAATADNLHVFLPSEGSGNGRWLRCGVSLSADGVATILAGDTNNVLFARSDHGTVSMRTSHFQSAVVGNALYSRNAADNNFRTLHLISFTSITLDSNGAGIGNSNPATACDVSGAITQRPLSADPADPAAGRFVQWVSDGTGSGDAGDVMIKINVGGTVKTSTLIDFSALA